MKQYAIIVIAGFVLGVAIRQLILHAFTERHLERQTEEIQQNLNDAKTQQKD